jgi:hypothetical protein
MKSKEAFEINGSKYWIEKVGSKKIDDRMIIRVRGIGYDKRQARIDIETENIKVKEGKIVDSL